MPSIRERGFKTRRWFLKSFPYLVLGGYVAASVSLDLISFGSEETGGEKTEFSTDGADYTFIQGTHGSAMFDEQGAIKTVGVRPLSPRLLPDDFDAIVVEYPTNYLVPRESRRLMNLFGLHPFFAKVASEIFRRGADVIANDLASDRARQVIVREVAQIPPFVFALTELKRWASGTELKGVENMALAVVAGWLGVNDLGRPIVQTAFNLSEGETRLALARAEIIFEGLHPEERVGLRNLAIAAKSIGMESYYRNILGRRPHFVLVNGSGHLGLPGYFARGRESCLGKIDGLYGRWLSYLLEEPRTMWNSLRIVQRNGEILKEEVVVDNEIKKRLSG